MRGGKRGGEGAKKAGLGAWRSGPGWGPQPGHFRDSHPPCIPYRAPLLPLSQNSCERAGQGAHVMGRKSKTPRQEGICPDSHNWFVARMELWGEAYRNSVASHPVIDHSSSSSTGWPTSPTPFMVQNGTLRPRTAQGCAFSPVTLVAVAVTIQKAQTRLLAALLAA